ncbi:hypothetical protein BSLG_006694 [Batrachochytrium salamandrivorans]|nr:hypothetical protein BSLG_006694 [Batrachochytrium salamandrivorans]
MHSHPALLVISTIVAVCNAQYTSSMVPDYTKTSSQSLSSWTPEAIFSSQIVPDSVISDDPYQPETTTMYNIPIPTSYSVAIPVETNEVEPILKATSAPWRGRQASLQQDHRPALTPVQKSDTVPVHQMADSSPLPAPPPWKQIEEVARIELGPSSFSSKKLQCKPRNWSHPQHVVCRRFRSQFSKQEPVKHSKNQWDVSDGMYDPSRSHVKRTHHTMNSQFEGKSHTKSSWKTRRDFDFVCFVIQYRDGKWYSRSGEYRREKGDRSYSNTADDISKYHQGSKWEENVRNPTGNLGNSRKHRDAPEIVMERIDYQIQCRDINTDKQSPISYYVRPHGQIKKLVPATTYKPSNDDSSPTAMHIPSESNSPNVKTWADYAKRDWSPPIISVSKSKEGSHWYPSDNGKNAENVAEAAWHYDNDMWDYSDDYDFGCFAIQDAATKPAQSHPTTTASPYANTSSSAATNDHIRDPTPVSRASTKKDWKSDECDDDNENFNTSALTTNSTAKISFDADKTSMDATSKYQVIKENKGDNKGISKLDSKWGDHKIEPPHTAPKCIDARVRKGKCNYKKATQIYPPENYNWFTLDCTEVTFVEPCKYQDDCTSHPEQNHTVLTESRQREKVDPATAIINYPVSTPIVTPALTLAETPTYTYASVPTYTHITGFVHPPSRVVSPNIPLVSSASGTFSKVYTATASLAVAITFAAILF